MANTHVVLHHTHPMLEALLPARLRGPAPWFRTSALSYGALYAQLFYLFSPPRVDEVEEEGPH
jgi:hypothetical protein